MARGEDTPRGRQLAGLRARRSLPDYASRMAAARRWRRTHWHVDWGALARAEGGLASQQRERAEGMAFARAWREQYRGVDWNAVVAEEAFG